MNGGGGDGCVLVEINPSVHDQSAEAVGTPIIDESDGFLDLVRDVHRRNDVAFSLLNLSLKEIYTPVCYTSTALQ